MIPNIIDEMSLSPSAIRLYLHFKRVAGESGRCYQTQEVLSKSCQMAELTIRRAKTELLKNELIRLNVVIEGAKRIHVITIVDIWAENDRYYSSKSIGLKSNPMGVTNSPDSGLESNPTAGYNVPAKKTPLRRTIEEDNILDEKPDEKISEDNVRVKWGELKNVKLSPREHRDLVQRFGIEETKRLIDRLSLYIGSKGDKYKSHHATILNWVKMDEKRKEQNGRNGANRGRFEPNQKYTEYEDKELAS
jgi:hypothetical protein